ncbi:MAG: hypothetical protein IJW63_11815 [Lachnospiraceae bacterium]|nr:hypothetical protein [Lachnospiraceae bacterium]
MKKVLIHFASIFALAVALLSLAGCGSKGNTLFEKAAPNNSALIMYEYGYMYDGSDTKEGVQYSMYTAATEKEFLAELSNVNAKEVNDWSLEDLSFPIYGMWIGTAEGNSLNIAWSGNYLITEEGKVYNFDLDMKDLLSKYEWQDVDSFTNATFFPCSRVLSLDEDGWTPTLLKEVNEMNPPSGISMELVERKGNLFTIKLTNNTEEEWCYGTYFSVQAYIDGAWYDIPAIPGNWAFHDIAMILKPGASVEETYNIGMYGDLPAGEYRLEVEDMTLEFEEE